MTVGAKIAAIMALLMFPIGHLTLLFVQQVRKDVAFSSLEIEGAKVLKPVWDTLAISAAPQSDPAGLKAAVERTSAVRAAAAEMKASEAVALFISALVDPKAVAKAWDAGQVAIQKIADGSNLTLDPDVDSYYMMDVVAVRLPELIIARAALDTALQPYLIGSGTPSASAHDALVQAGTRFDIALAATQGSLKSGIDGNSDGSLGRSLLPMLNRFKAASSRISQLVDALRLSIAQGKPAPTRKAEFDSAASALADSTQGLWQSVQAELIA